MFAEINCGQWIVQNRRYLGMTQQDLANEICVNILTIKNWEKGKNPTKNNLLKLKQLFDLKTKKPEGKSIEQLQLEELLSIKNNQMKIIHLLEKIASGITSLTKISDAGTRGKIAGQKVKEYIEDIRKGKIRNQLLNEKERNY